MMKNATKCLVAIGLAAGITGVLRADDFKWTGLAGDGKWETANNWTNLTTPGIGVPPNDGTVGGITVDPVASTLPVTIAASTTVVFTGTIYGPEWGQTINIFGTMHAGYSLAPVGAINGATSTINLYGTASATAGDSIFVGDPWWAAGIPNVTFNLYNSSSMGVNWFSVAGHVNLYDNSAIYCTNGFLTGTATTGTWGSTATTDATRLINIAGGTLVQPTGKTSALTDLIVNRGILRCYGKAYDTNADGTVKDFIITDDGNYTTLTVPALGAIQNIYLQPLNTTMISGTRQTPVAVGNYANVSDVVLSGLDTNQLVGQTVAYVSSATNIVSVSTDGYLLARNLGTATITATLGSQTSTNSVVITVIAATNSLLHRYSFSETSGTTTVDSITGNSPTWDATLNGGATLGSGQVSLDGASGYVQLPAGILTNLDVVTIETWVSLTNVIPNWGVLFTFGNTDSGSGLGMDYISCQPHTSGNTFQIGISDADPGYNHEQDAWQNGVLDGLTNLHVVAIFYPSAGYTAIYTNGVQAAINTGVTIPLSALALDPLNYLGRSLYSGDPYFGVSYDEFRIYQGLLSESAIRADAALGPNQLIGSSTNISLKAAVSSANLVLHWPTSSALVTLLSSPTLGSSAVWTEVTSPVTLNGTNYEVTIPTISSAQFYRLKK